MMHVIVMFYAAISVLIWVEWSMENIRSNGTETNSTIVLWSVFWPITAAVLLIYWAKFGEKPWRKS